MPEREGRTRGEHTSAVGVCSKVGFAMVVIGGEDGCGDLNAVAMRTTSGV